MFVLGIDPGLSRCGYGVVRQYGSDLTAMAGGVVTTAPDLPLQERLHILFTELRALVTEVRPDAVVVERVFFQTNVRTAMATGQAGGIALLVAAEAGCEVAQYSANEVKQAVVGFGGATKDQVQRMVAALLGLVETPKPPDVADALALAVCHLTAQPLRRAIEAAGSGDSAVIGWLRGALVTRSPEGELIVDVGGVGYRVTVSPTLLAAVGERGALIELHVHTHVREDAIVLYGFASAEERRCFEALLGAHGVGPTLALAVLSALRPADLVRAVLEEDLGALCTVPGVGRKTAARLVLDLRSRLELPAFAGDGVPGGHAGPAEARGEVRAALAELGYGPDEIRRALDAGQDGTVEELLRHALRELAGAR